LDRRLARRVLALPRGQDLAHDGLVDLRRLDLGALHRLFDRQRAELRGGQRRQAAVERADGGARGAGDYDIGHLRSSPLWRLDKAPRMGAMSRRWPRAPRSAVTRARW